ncbi:unnamed protein product [Hymenolepis diminuta]|uniref:U2 snRNP-associated SURP motif-containing protein n=1 Tax=Hymenolepis diminuta TaxID=6216 RepID=A0A0R3SSD7_HYMDI|nr:unnamed protein product [Hymenolepis diminuta]
MLRKAEEEMKRKAEEAEVAKALQDFENTFQKTNKIERTWVKGGVVKPGSGGKELCTQSFTEITLEQKVEAGPSVYKPVAKFGDKSKALEIGKVEHKAEGAKKPVIGRKGPTKKMTNLELFKEELKSIQQQREQRHQLRQQNRARGMSDSKIPPALPPSELSLDFEDMDKRNRLRDYGYPYDEDSDKSSTNLFLGNLCPKMTEQQLCDVFGRYGPLASVKIMWPRTEEQRAVARNCGFVAYMNRLDAERALENLRGKEFMGYEMKLGWGKTVPIPAFPVYVPPPLLELIKPPSQSGLPFNAQPRDWLRPILPIVKERAKMATDSFGNGDFTMTQNLPPAPDKFPYNIHTMPKETFNKVLEEAVVKVIIPTDRTILAIIHRLIEFVVREGPQFEAAIMNKEERNSQYKQVDFKIILWGESVNKWSSEEFRMYEGGPLWRPPPVNFFATGMPEELVEPADYPVASGYSGKDEAAEAELHNEALRRGASGDRSTSSGLTQAQRDRLTVWINDLEPSRAQIGDVMVWCLEHADAAPGIVDIIVKSLKPKAVSEGPTQSDSDESEFALKPPASVSAAVARLFLASDILYNSGAKVSNASFYRKCFESRLLEVFTDLGVFYHDLEGKLKTEQMKQKVMSCFRAWEEWAIYPNDFLIQLQNVFLGLTPNVPKAMADEMDEDELAGVPLDGEPLSAAAAAGMTAIGGNVESLDGAPLVQYDGDPLDVDGSPLAHEGNGGSAEDDEDIEGVPLDINSLNASDVNKSTAAPAPLFVPSKWESVDPDKAVEEAVTSNRWDIFADPSAVESPDDQMAEVRVSKDDSDEDVDGRPLDAFCASGMGLVAYDDDDVVSPVLSPQQQISEALSSSSQPVNEPMSDTRRQALREIEVKVLKYQDELESAKRRGDSVTSENAIKQQVDRYRERLLERLDETSSIPESSSLKNSMSSSKPAKAPSKPSRTSSGSSSKHHRPSSNSGRRHEDRSSNKYKRSKSPDASKKDHPASPFTAKRSRGDGLTAVREEGETSSDDISSARKRPKYRDDEGRHRDRSPKRSRRSRSPSPSKRKTGGNSTPGRSSQKRR